MPTQSIEASSSSTVQPLRALHMDPASPLVFIVNAASGRHDPAQTRQTIEAVLKTAGRTGELLFTQAADLDRTAARAARTAAARHSAIIAVGGDGTFNSVAEAAHAEGCAMGLVPQGTFNYFARTHDIPQDAAAAVEVLLRSAPVPVQVGLINDRVFLVNASLGLYPEVLQDREAYKARFGRSRLVAFGAALVTLLGKHRQLRLRIELGAEIQEVVTPTLFVGNNRLQLEQVGLKEARTLDKGCIAAVMLRPVGTLSMLGLLFRGATGTLGEADLVESFTFHRMVVRPWLSMGGRMVKVAFDGEVSRMRAPLEFKVSSRPLYLLKPTSGKGAVDAAQGSP